MSSSSRQHQSETSISVLFVAPSYSPSIGGAQTFLETIGQRLARDGHNVTILTTKARCTSDLWGPPDSSRPLLPAREALDGVTVERLSLTYPWPAPYTVGLARRASYWVHRSGLSAPVQKRLLRSLGRWMPPLRGLQDALARLIPGVDLVQAVDSSWDGLFTTSEVWAQRHGKAFIAMPLMHLGDANVKSRFQMVHQVDAYCAAEAVLALSQQEATAYTELGVPRKHVHTIPMGVDPEWRDRLQGNVSFRRRYGLTAPVVAFVGAHTYDKGVFTLARAVARLNQAGLQVHLVCAGPGSDRLRNFVQKQPERVRSVLADQMQVLGTVSEETKHELLAACDVLALPSRVDTFGIVLLEAGLHGKPVIGADAGGIPEVVDANRTGLLVPFGDVRALTDAVRRLLTRPEMAARLGDAAQQRVLQEYTWDRTYQSLLEIYGAVL